MKKYLISTIIFLLNIIKINSLNQTNPINPENLPEPFDQVQQLDQDFQNELDSLIKSNEKPLKKPKNQFLKEGKTFQIQSKSTSFSTQYLFKATSDKDFKIVLQSDHQKVKDMGIKVGLSQHTNKDLMNKYSNYTWATHTQQKTIESEYAHILQVNVEEIECDQNCIFYLQTYGIGNQNITIYYDKIYLQQNQQLVQNMEMGETMYYFFNEPLDFYLTCSFFTKQSYLSVKLLKNVDNILLQKKIQRNFMQKIANPKKNFKKNNNNINKNKNEYEFQLEVTALQDTEMQIGFIDYPTYIRQLKEQQMEEDKWHKEEFIVILLGCFFCSLAYFLNKMNQRKKFQSMEKRYNLIKQKFAGGSESKGNKNTLFNDEIL